MLQLGLLLIVYYNEVNIVYNIKTMNKIAAVGLDRLPAGTYAVGDAVENEDAILVRSAKLHDYPLPEKLWAIARAGAGVNNIPVDKCSEAGIVVFNTPGANANAVKELVICALLNIKLPTTKTHVRNLFKKLKVSSRAEAQKAAKRLGLI